MPTISQEHPYGCGVACVAYVICISYKEALKLFENPTRSESAGYLCKEIVEALKKFGLRYDYRYVKLRSKLPKIPNCIVFVRRSKMYPAGHYLARSDDGKWMDPWVSFPLVPYESGWRRRLPDRAIYVIHPID